MNKKLAVPTGVKLTPFDPDYLRDPYPVLKLLRELDPVHHDVELKRYFLCNYDDVKRVHNEPKFVTNPYRSKPDSYARNFLPDDSGEVSMILADDPQHRRQRAIVDMLLTPSIANTWRSRIVEIVEQCLDSIEAAEFDLIGEYAERIPMVVMAEFLGISSHRHEEFRKCTMAAVEATYSPAPSEDAVTNAQSGSETLTQLFIEEIEMRRKDAKAGAILSLMNAEFDGEKLPEDEIVSLCSLLLLAGKLTTTDLIGNGVRALLDHTDQRELLLTDQTLIKKAVEEILRYDSPVLNSPRITSEFTEISGCPIQKGECLHLSIAAANRDPKVFEDPESFKIQRTHYQHQSFGGGRHFCPGATLARIEGQEAILRLFKRFPNLAHSGRGLAQNLAPEFRGMAYCWLTT